MRELRLDGGNVGGAVRVGNTVRRVSGPWTPAVHAVLSHLARKDFAGSPRAQGFDAEGREILTFLPGETVGSHKPWPAWVLADATLDHVARWLRSYHEAIADFVPAEDAVWRTGGRWEPGLIIGHNDAAPYNAVWRDGRVAGFFDWDFAGPVTVEWDLAYAAFSWVPLHARSVVAEYGFQDFAGRPRRLRRFLDRYGWPGELDAFLGVMRARLRAHADGVRDLAASGDPAFARLAEQGVIDDLDRALIELELLDF
ncbi:MAG: phosphotransferase [Mycobacteriales bacterium]